MRGPKLGGKGFGELLLKFVDPRGAIDRNLAHYVEKGILTPEQATKTKIDMNDKCADFERQRAKAREKAAKLSRKPCK